MFQFNKQRITLFVAFCLLSFIAGYRLNATRLPLDAHALSLGAFSVSLSVVDLVASKIFYEKLGFEAFAGSEEQGYLIMKNQSTLIGLFKGMFKGNMLTFNPGWDADAQNTPTFDDVRTIQQQAKRQGLTLVLEADSSTIGPASIMLYDPDSNLLLIDQHR